MLMSVDLVECATYVSTRAQRVTSYFKAYPWRSGAMRVEKITKNLVCEYEASSLALRIHCYTFHERRSHKYIVGR
jgi:hypothetical protein